MRILMPNHFPLQGSGSGIYTLNVAQELVKLGHEVLVIVPDHAQVSNETYPFPTRVMVFADGDNAEIAEIDFNFPCFTTHPRSVTTFYELTNEQIAEYAELWRKHIQEAVGVFQPDIIHAHHVWITPFVSSETGLPYVISIHGTDLMGYRDGPRYREFAKIAAERAFGLIAISQQVRDDTLSTFDIPAEKVHLIANGFDGNIFKVLPDVNKSAVFEQFDLPYDGEVPVVSFVGKFTDFKGIDVLLRAAAIYETELPGVRTLLVGHGQLWQEMHDLREELNLEGIYFLGHQPQPTVTRVYNIADVSIVPSRIEPFGLVAVEALACGTPVVATNAGGLPDFINDKVGALVPLGDHQALAEAIVAEIQAGSKQTKGRYAAQYALDGYSWPSQVKKMVDLYRKALATES
jgi:glycosyltransferase involved in cell wall biosynthesis